MDLQGHVVTLQTPFEGAREASYLATSQPDPLVSQFTPSYGMVLNLLQTHTLERARELVERSFGQYMATLHLRPNYQEIAEIKAELTILQGQIAAVNQKDIAMYEKLRQRLKVERQIFKTLQEQSREDRQEQLAMMLDFAVSGTLLSLKDKNMTATLPITAVLVGKSLGISQNPYFICLGQDNRWYVATSADVVDLYAELPRVNIPADILPPAELFLKRGLMVRGDDYSGAIATNIPDPGEITNFSPELAEQFSRVSAVQEQLESNPLHQSGNAANLFKNKARCIELEAEVETLEGEVGQQSQRHWEEFLNLIQILQQFGGLEQLIPTRLGKMAAAIRGENELWLGLVFASNELNDLDPHHLAAAAAALVTETPRPDTKVRFEPSQEIIAGLEKLRGLRRQLFQLQRRYNVALPIWLEVELIAVVEQWALGKEWIELCENTTLDEGDVVRLLRRTLDLLSQIPHIPDIPDSLRRNAQRAMQLIDRFPVNEVME
jgi:superfamily II RNA helicase